LARNIEIGPSLKNHAENPGILGWKYPSKLPGSHSSLTGVSSSIVQHPAVLRHGLPRQIIGKKGEWKKTTLTEELMINNGN